jgi:hypothetical protein
MIEKHRLKELFDACKTEFPHNNLLQGNLILFRI